MDADSMLLRRPAVDRESAVDPRLANVGFASTAEVGRLDVPLSGLSAYAKS